MPRLMIPRRAALQGLLAMTASSATAASQTMPHKHNERTLPANDPAFALRTLGRLQGDLSGRITYTYNPGFVFGIVTGRALAPGESGQLLYQVEGCTKRVSRVLEDGSIEERSRSWMVYCDADTGDYLQEFHNPYTDETIVVPAVRGGPAVSRLTLNGPVLPASLGLESTLLDTPPRLHWRVLGERVWISRYAASRITVANGKPRNELSMDAWVCHLSDLLDEQATHIPSTYTWTSHADWQSWLQMQDHPGSLLWRVESVVMHEQDQLPSRFRAQLERVAPGQINQPLP